MKPFEKMDLTDFLVSITVAGLLFHLFLANVGNLWKNHQMHLFFLMF